MRLIPSLLVAFSFLSFSIGQDTPSAQKETHDYQSDVARLRKIVINSLYSHRDVFLRELISNSNDALEKLRIVSLTEKSLVQPDEPLNITIKLVRDENGKGGRVIIADTGIGMTPEELTKNLGTLAKSGTSDFISKAEADAGNTGSLIGQFGLGFYSSFLVSSHVYVASVPAHPPSSTPPTQYVFSSSADAPSFEVYPDPRGNTLGRGTEITLILKDDALEFLNEAKVKELVEKHSSFSTTYPIYLFTTKTEEVLDSTEAEDPVASASIEAKAESPASSDAEDELEQAVVEELLSEDDETLKEFAPITPRVKNITSEQWLQLNDQPPIWTRDPKSVTVEEYDAFYRSTYKDEKDPLAYLHFSGDAGSSVSFKSILFIPSELPEGFWQSSVATVKGVRLLVKRVFITSDLGEDALPKWLSWLKAIVDADDLPLNVSRETLQSTKFLAQIKNILIKRVLSLLTRLAKEEDDTKYRSVWKSIGPALKLGAVDSTGKQREQLSALARWQTNMRDFVGLDAYAANRKKGQKQIFYLAGVGQSPEDLSKSVFIEKLHARGYEVLLLTEPMDEILVGNLRHWQGMQFQDAAKKGLQFGDEDLDAEEEKAEQASVAEQYKPLMEWLKKETKGIVLDVVLSNRLVTSPCAIVADKYGYSANMQRLMATQQHIKDGGEDWMTEFAKKQRSLEINPKSPLIEGMLRVVEGLDLEEPSDDAPEREISQAEAELKEVTQILLDGALVRSGFDVSDPNLFFTRVDSVLRRSLGVSELAQAKVDIKPAPPVEEGPLNPVFDEPPVGPTEDDLPFDPQFEAHMGGQQPFSMHDEL